jgi:hypothetical protein
MRLGRRNAVPQAHEPRAAAADLATESDDGIVCAMFSGESILIFLHALLVRSC